MILSDIDINREVECENLYFFRAGNHEDLAGQMMLLSQKEIRRPSKAALLSRGREQADRLGETLMAALTHTLQKPV